LISKEKTHLEKANVAVRTDNGEAEALAEIGEIGARGLTEPDAVEEMEECDRGRRIAA
jgi:hypothetical protein